MIKVSVMYANEPGARFDHDYYRDKHMPLLEQRLGARLKKWSVDRGIAGRSGTAAPFIAMCHMYCDSIDDYEAGIGPHRTEIVGDVAKYTDLEPIIQVSEVVVG